MIFLDNVSKSFIKENEPQEILQNISLNVDTGEFLCIVGPSGCGKTSILRLIAGLDFPTRGRITESEIQIEGPSPERGYVFQQFSLFPWRNVLENVTFGLEVKGMRKEERNKKHASTWKWWNSPLTKRIIQESYLGDETKSCYCSFSGHQPSCAVDG